MLTIELGGHTVTTTNDKQEIIVNGETIVIQNCEGKVFIWGRPLPETHDTEG